MATNQKKNNRSKNRRKQRKTKRRKYRRGTKRRRKRTRRRRGKGLISSMGKHVIKGSNTLMSLTPQGQVTKLSTKALCNRKNPPPVCKSMTLTPEQRANIVEQKLTGGLI